MPFILGQRSKTFHQPLRAVIFDWAGTIIDFGSCAPAGAFVSLFSRRKIEISDAQARVPMGKAKWDHIAEIAAMPEVARQWQVAYGRAVTAADIDAMYGEFLPIQQSALAVHSSLVEGVVPLLAELRHRGLKLGGTSGYARELMETLLPLAAAQGCELDTTVTATDVSGGRPLPLMIWECARRLNVYPPSSLVVVDDTPVGIQAGVNAGAWTVGVVTSGNLMGLPLEKFQSLSAAERSQRIATGVSKMQEAGAHYILETVADLPVVLADIDRQVAARKAIA